VKRHRRQASAQLPALPVLPARHAVIFRLIREGAARESRPSHVHTMPPQNTSRQEDICVRVVCPVYTCLIRSIVILVHPMRELRSKSAAQCAVSHEEVMRLFTR